MVMYAIYLEIEDMFCSVCIWKLELLGRWIKQNIEGSQIWIPRVITLRESYWLDVLSAVRCILLPP